MRVAAVAFVLIVGAAVVLVLANTLNSWVLGGLLGGLAAILLCIPISLAIFSLLARRQEARQRVPTGTLEPQEEMDFAGDVYEEELMAYEADGYLPSVEEPLPDPRSYPQQTKRRAPVSGYLPLPPVEQDLDFSDTDDPQRMARRDPRNYPRQPRYPARSLAHDAEVMPSPPSTGSTRRDATRSLAQHQSAALRKARQEAQRQQRQTQKRGSSDSLARRSSGSRFSPTQHPRTSHSLRPPEHAPDLYRAENEYESRRARQRPAQSAWNEEEDPSGSFTTDELRERYPQYPRRPSYPRNPRNSRARPAEPWTGTLDGEEGQEEPRSPRSRRNPERLSGNLHNPLVRRAPYLYEDDPLNEEFSRQLDNDHPITRRSSLYEHYDDE